MRTVILVAHATLGAVWLGAMTYSLAVVQPRAAAFFRMDDEHEAFVTALAANNRRNVLALIAGIGITGLLLFPYGKNHGIAIPIVKAVLLVAATAVFWRVSWRIWPRRIFAMPEELPALRTSLRRSAWTLIALVGLAFALGVAASHPG